jgi:hypothetical protein
MKVLVACEFSGIVREAFRAKGHDAFSCDLLPSEIPGNHIQDDVLKHLNEGWDLMIAHPPCTHLAVSGAAWFKEKQADGRQQESIGFFMKLVNAPIYKIAIENPVCIMSTQYRKPDQIINPFQFGHPEPKKTCLWLKNLPLLKPTKVVTPEWIIGKRDGKKYSRIHYRTVKTPNRWMERSRTFKGIAEAMAEQWG